MAANDTTGGAHLNNRMCASHKLLANVIAAVAGGMPTYIDVATYPLIGTIQRGAAPVTIGGGIWAYRPMQETKILKLKALSDTGAADTTATWDIALTPRYEPGRLGVLPDLHRVVLTLGTRALAARATEPFTDTALAGSNVLRQYDTAVWTYRDTGDLQIYDKGFDAANGAGGVIVDMSGYDMILVMLQAKPAASVRELLGMAEECS